MKKLDNKGWGLNTMIIFLVVMLLFILVIAILSYKMGIEKDSKNPIYNNNNNTQKIEE